jgi:ketosteroid isomerase-like protein
MNADTLRTAFEVLAARDVEPLVTLMHPDMAWRGRRTWRSFLTRPARGP